MNSLIHIKVHGSNVRRLGPPLEDKLPFHLDLRSGERRGSGSVHCLSSTPIVNTKTHSEWRWRRSSGADAKFCPAHDHDMTAPCQELWFQDIKHDKDTDLEDGGRGGDGTILFGFKRRNAAGAQIRREAVISLVVAAGSLSFEFKRGLYTLESSTYKKQKQNREASVIRSQRFREAAISLRALAMAIYKCTA